jgi:hypothetical protein
MNQPTNPAWQGAVNVGRARLHTIDEALTKLEAAVPNVDAQPPVPPSQPPANAPTPVYPNNQPPVAIEAQSSKSPNAFPAQSLQALEAFMSGAI